jgi:type III secretory pathway component EscR
MGEISEVGSSTETAMMKKQNAIKPIVIQLNRLTACFPKCSFITSVNKNTTGQGTIPAIIGNSGVSIILQEMSSATMALVMKIPANTMKKTSLRVESMR